MGAVVTMRRYPGRPHTVGADEIDMARRLVEPAFAGVR
jgi:phospholipase/carboxylesterase